MRPAARSPVVAKCGVIGQVVLAIRVSALMYLLIVEPCIYLSFYIRIRIYELIN